MHCILAMHCAGLTITTTHHVAEFVALAGAAAVAARMWVNQVAMASDVRSATDGVGGASFGGCGRSFRSAGVFLLLLRLHHRCWALLFSLYPARPELGAGAGGRGVRFAVRSACVCLCVCATASLVAPHL